VLEDGPDVSELLFDMLPRVAAGGKQIHDANLVATMRAHRVRHLMTFNVDDFRRYAGIIDIVTP
jgi:predicted nucleic acid-binding protein